MSFSWVVRTAAFSSAVSSRLSAQKPSFIAAENTLMTSQRNEKERALLSATDACTKATTDVYSADVIATSKPVK